MNLVKVISTSIDKLNRRLIKVLRFGRSDVQTPLESMPFGEDSNPIKDLIAVYSETEEKGKTVIVGYLNKNQLAAVGEKRIYSIKDNGELSTFIWLKNDGTMQVGGDTDFMVRYSGLETAFNQLKTDFDNLVTAYNTHIHVTTATVGGGGTPGVISPTTSTGSPSTADITGAKIEEIKTL